MKKFELRLAQEHAQTSRHLRNLRLFIGDDSRFNRLTEQQRSLIRAQEKSLSQYVGILEQRMTLLNIPI